MEPYKLGSSVPHQVEQTPDKRATNWQGQWTAVEDTTLSLARNVSLDGAAIRLPAAGVVLQPGQTATWNLLLLQQANPTVESFDVFLPVLTYEAAAGAFQPVLTDQGLFDIYVDVAGQPALRVSNLSASAKTLHGFVLFIQYAAYNQGYPQ